MVSISIRHASPSFAWFVRNWNKPFSPEYTLKGQMTRFAALVPLGMTAVIEIFVYPQAWPTHIQWAAMLLVLFCRGAGALSLDHPLWRLTHGEMMRWHGARLSAWRADSVQRSAGAG
jgi:hypothetical protein